MNKKITKDTILKQGEKEYKGIETDGGIVWVDKDSVLDTMYTRVRKNISTAMGRLYLHNGEKVLGRIIASTLDLEEVPKIVIEDELPIKEAEKILKSHRDYEAEGFSEYQNGRFNGIIEGLQHNPAQFTEEDIRKAIQATVNECNKLQKESYGDLEINVDEIIHSFTSIKLIEVDEQFKVINYE